MTREEKLETIVKLFSKTMFYGNWKSETSNERVIEMLMKEVGYYPFKDEDEMIYHTSVDDNLYKQAMNECCSPAGQVKRYVNCVGCDRKPIPRDSRHGVVEGAADMKKCEEILILMKLAEMTLTEINTLSDGERAVLSHWFLENVEREQQMMKQYKV